MVILLKTASSMNRTARERTYVEFQMARRSKIQYNLSAPKEQAERKVMGKIFQKSIERRCAPFIFAANLMKNELCHSTNDVVIAMTA